MRKFSLFFSLILCSPLLFGTIIHTEDFNYATGSLLEGQGTPAWTVSTKVNGATSPSLIISDTTLQYLYYGGSSTVGKGVIIPSVITADRTIYQHFSNGTSYSSGTLYAAFLLKVKTATSKSRDFLTFEGATGTTQRARLFIRDSGDNYKLGVTRGSSSPVAWIDNLKIDSVYLIVLKYEFLSGTLNDIATLYANFPIGYSETSSSVKAASIVSTDFEDKTSDPSSLKGISIKQRVDGSEMQIAHLRVANTWEEVIAYSGPAVEPEDPNKTFFHFQEGFDSNGSWTITGGSSTSQNHGDFGSAKRSINFNRTESSNRCDNAIIQSPKVNTAGVLRFWIKGSSSVTQANVRVDKIIGSDTTQLAYYPPTFGSTWTEYMLVINDSSNNISILFTINGCQIGTGTLYIDDISLTNFKGSTPPIITNITRTPLFVDTKNTARISANITEKDSNDYVQMAIVLWGYSADSLTHTESMSKTGTDLYTSENIAATEEDKMVYYRIVAYDSHYVSDTSVIENYKIYRKYENSIVVPDLASGESFIFEKGLTDMRINYLSASGAANLEITNNGALVGTFTETGNATTGDLKLQCESGKQIKLTNKGTHSIAINNFLYNNFHAVLFTEKPVHLQLYPREANNKANVPISGTIQHSVIDSITVCVFRDNILADKQIKKVGQGEKFNFTFPITAEMALYRFEYSTNEHPTSIVIADSVVAGDVYIIAGQSNGAASASGNVNTTNAYWRNFGCVQKTNAYNPADTVWGLSNSAGWGYGKQWYNGYSGYVIQRNLLANQKIPTAVLNMAVGGSTLAQNIRNDSKHDDIETFYGRGLYRAIKAGVRTAVKAIIWVQGESDQNGAYDQYAERFGELYNAWKEDYPALQHIYVSQINVGCGTGDYASELREKQRLFGEIYNDITVTTNVGIEIRYDSCHYTDAGYEKLYTQYTNLIERDFYGKVFDKPITSPAVQNVAYTDANQQSITITFDQDMIWPEPLWNRNLKDYFFDQNNMQIPVLNGFISEKNAHQVILKLAEKCEATHLTYGPDSFVHSPTRGIDTIYVDPWLRNADGYAALTFNHYPINAYTAATDYPNRKPIHLICKENVLIVEAETTIDSICIFSSDGKTVCRSESAFCNLNSLTKGMYLLQIQLSDGNKFIEKFVYQ